MRIWFNKTFSTIAAVLRNLRQAERPDEITLICTHNHDTATAFLAADEHYLEPSELYGQDYLEWCLAFCRQHRISIFWPGKEAILISAHHADFNALGVHVVSVAAPETLTLLHNKAHFYSALPKTVATTMDFRAVNNRDDFEAAIKELSNQHEKLCIKPAVSVYGLGFRILDTHRDSISQILKGVEHHIPLQELQHGMINTPQFDTLLVMEHLGGFEWSVDCVGDHGQLLCAVQRKKIPHAGHGQVIDNQDDIHSMVERLTAHYQLNGIFNIQFKEGVHGIRLLEINPRPSGGFGMSCLAGVNLAYLALQTIRGESVSLPAIRYGLKINEVNTPVIVANA